MSDDRLPTELWLDAHFRTMTAKGMFYYVLHKGAYASGMVMVKINGLDGMCRLLQQQREYDFDTGEAGEVGWMNVFDAETAPEGEADSYIKRAVERDPDLWVVEVENREFENPFDGKMIRI